MSTPHNPVHCDSNAIEEAAYQPLNELTTWLSDGSREFVVLSQTVQNCTDRQLHPKVYELLGDVKVMKKVSRSVPFRMTIYSCRI